ncbi:host attachment family protein [Luteimonas sp. RD2P54]|uniref:Host attachment family protein n=1 Tax=Luteimonas endophytica TaxID=3042023 RepID=A0ABT6J8D7_9GAMM|nr:host attachment family protein [Luteimonas endophytica]MDH5823089.1 host attachment family protein [Luteimonas endophytica]
MKMPEGTLVVVADGGGARVFRNVGDERAPALRQEGLLELMNMNDDGPAGSMPSESSGMQIDEATFAKQLAQGLNEGALKNAYRHLVLMADPQTLGRIRPLLHKQTEERLLAEVAKTFTNAPLEDIERALA